MQREMRERMRVMRERRVREENRVTREKEEVGDKGTQVGLSRSHNKVHKGRK